MDNSVNGVLQSLMEQYQARMNPAEYQRQVQGRNALIDEYEQGVRNAPPGMSQFQMGVSNWLGAGGTGPNDIVRGVGNAQSQFAKQQLSQHEARQQGLLDTAKMRDQIAKEEDAALKSQIGLVTKTGLGKQPNPEKLQTIYTGAMNHFAQIAKDFDFSKVDPTDPAGARAAWIKEQANAAVQNYIEKFATQPTGPRGEEVKAFEPSAIEPTQNTTGVPTQQVVSDFVGNKPSTPKDFPGVTADVQANRDADRLAILKDEYARVKQVADKYNNDVSNPEVSRALADMARLKKEMSGIKVVEQPAVPTTPTQQVRPEVKAAPLIAPQLRDKAAEKAREKELSTVSEGYAKQYTDVQKSASSAQNTLGILDNVERNLEGYNTGKLTPAAKEIAAWVKPLGISIDENLPRKEAFEKTVNQLTLNLKNAGGENNMPGSLSDSDRKFLETQAPSLSNTPEGNRLVIDYYRRVANRQLEMAKQADVYFEQNGTYKGFRKQWDEYAKANPLFGKAETKEKKRITITAEEMQKLMRGK